MAKQTALASKIAALDVEIARLTSIRDYLTADAPVADKPTRTRAPRKPRGLPKTTEAAKEGIF